MKKLVVISFLTVGLSQSILGQDVEKEWKKKLKELTPMEYKSKMDELEALKSAVSEKDKEINELKEKNTAAESTSRAEIDSLKALLANQPAAATTHTKSTLVADNSAPKQSTASSSNANKGVVFKVQIGAFRNKDLKKYFNNTENFTGDVEPDGTQKFTLGVFRDYWEADRFKKYLREMGVADAWIVAYKDGQRVDIKDVLEGVVK